MLVEVLSNTIGELLADIFGIHINQLRDQRAVRRALTVAIGRAETRFREEYHEQDAEIVQALTVQTRFADLPSVKASLRQILSHPFRDPSVQVKMVQKSFTDVLPEYTDRKRVDAALSTFLNILGQEVLLIPQLQATYSLMFQRTSAENSRDIANSTAALIQNIHDLRADVQNLPVATSPAFLEATSPTTSRLRPWHNLPRRTYSHFVGRQHELKQLAKLMLPHPRSRHFAVTLDGIGGVGKSALALEFAHRHREHYARIPADERFEAIVWVTGKRTVLTASGIQQRQQTFSTLADLYREIANVLDIPDVFRIPTEQQRSLVERALSEQRTLIIIDNLETIDDDELLTFIRELPDPTKVIVTTRHRIDIAVPIRILGMPDDDARELMRAAAANKQITLTVEDMDNLLLRTGGVPLALIWSISLMSLGYDVKSVIRRLGMGRSDIGRFCFSESIEHIRHRDAYRLLLSLALFEHSVNRVMLGVVAGLSDDEFGCDEGLAELERLSLINKEGDRFSLLPLTRTFALDELGQQLDLAQELREQWIHHLVECSQNYSSFDWRWRDLVWLRQEGMHFLPLLEWSRSASRPDISLLLIPGVLSYYEVTGQWAAVIEVAQAGVDTARLLGDRKSTLYIMHFMAWTLSQQGWHQEAERVVSHGLSIAREQDDHQWILEYMQIYSQVLRRARQFDKALTYCDKALKKVSELERTEQSFVQANIYYEMGKIARDQGDWQAAYTFFTAARSVFREDDESRLYDLSRAWGLLSNLGFVAYHLGNLDEAAHMVEQALNFFVSSGSPGDAATARIRLAYIEAARMHSEVAFAYAQEALELSKRLGMVEEQAHSIALLAQLRE